MDHDRRFKELLTIFFREFVAAFLPAVAAYLDPDTPIEFLDKEVFTDVTEGEIHEVDLVAKVRFRGQDTFFLIHVENQASAESNFSSRMFVYFSRLYEKHSLPIYPVVIFSYDTPLRPEPNRFEIAFPDKTVLQFEYTTIQLNRLSWREFVKQPNPVATALMAKMKIAPRDRPKVRSECFRLLATLKLDPARSKLIGGFIETYLQLNAEEKKQYELEFAKLTPAEKEATMDMMTSWERKGRHEGKEELVIRQLNRRIGSVSPEIVEQLDRLSSEQLNELGVALFDIATIADLENWLSHHDTP